ncbi:hypothetical protein N5C10_07605 [Acinetobacter johnsonii]|uniref:Uncharacterized protein n=1 Tax=Acinetobacter johnsonii TaxID=40214 RepID=A0AA42MST1_ACIJO|nr:hypothetical protein [Acinetobacter johnsonii]MDH0969133.1 hypothetical protein [Acinetobacter johnsonii]
MGLVNVEKVEAQEQREKSWFKRHFPKLAAAGAATGALVVSTSSMAFMEAADVTSATGAAGGEAVLKAAGTWVLAIAVGIAVVVKIVSLVKK